MIRCAHVIGQGRLGQHWADRLDSIGIDTIRWSQRHLILFGTLDIGRPLKRLMQSLSPFQMAPLQKWHSTWPQDSDQVRCWPTMLAPCPWTHCPSRRKTAR